VDEFRENAPGSSETESAFFLHAERAIAVFALMIGCLLLALLVYSLVQRSKTPPIIIRLLPNSTAVQYAIVLTRVAVAGQFIWAVGCLIQAITGDIPEITVTLMGGPLNFLFIAVLALVPHGIATTKTSVAAVTFWVVALTACAGWSLVVYAGRTTRDLSVPEACTFSEYAQCRIQATIVAGMIIMVLCQTFTAVALAFFVRDVTRARATSAGQSVLAGSGSASGEGEGESDRSYEGVNASVNQDMSAAVPVTAASSFASRSQGSRDSSTA